MKVQPPKMSTEPRAVRAFIAVSMVALLGAALLVTLLLPPPEKSFSQDILLVLITALVTKFGTVVDWHFGSSNAKERPAGTPTDPVSIAGASPEAQPVSVIPADADSSGAPAFGSPTTTGDG